MSTSPVIGRASTPTEKRVVIERLQAAWCAMPHQRLGQLIANACGGDSFYTEDTTLAERCETFAKKEGGRTSAIITPALVRRYLVATGYRRVPWGWTRSKPGLHEWTAVEAGFHHVDDLVTLIERAAADGGGNAHELCARLGMLATAEMTREYALVEAAGVDPVAWEKARGT